MKSLIEFILEKKDKEIDYTQDIIFDVWESPKKKVQELKSNNAYQKIEYKHKDYKNNVFIDFLLGFKNNSWHLWIGQNGGCNYSDAPYKDLKTDDFKKAIMNAVEEINKFINEVIKDPNTYIQYYKFSKDDNKDKTK